MSTVRGDAGPEGRTAGTFSFLYALDLKEAMKHSEMFNLECKLFIRLARSLYCSCAFPQAFLRPCQRVSSVHQVFVEPLASDDWEILVGGLRD